MPRRQLPCRSSPPRCSARALAAAALTSRAEDWAPISLVGLLFVLAAGSEGLLSFELKGLRLSASFLALVLAMALLGPAPAAAIGVACSLVDAVVSRRSIDRALHQPRDVRRVPARGRRS